MEISTCPVHEIGIAKSKQINLERYPRLNNNSNKKI